MYCFSALGFMKFSSALLILSIFFCICKAAAVMSMETEDRVWNKR